MTWDIWRKGQSRDTRRKDQICHQWGNFGQQKRMASGLEWKYCPAKTQARRLGCSSLLMGDLEGGMTLPEGGVRSRLRSRAICCRTCICWFTTTNTLLIGSTQHPVQICNKWPCHLGKDNEDTDEMGFLALGTFLVLYALLADKKYPWWQFAGVSERKGTGKEGVFFVHFCWIFWPQNTQVQSGTTVK